MNYTINEGTLSLPGSWHDSTINVLTTTIGGDRKAKIGLTITREQKRDHSTIGDYAASQVAELSSKLHNFELLTQQQRTLGDRPSVELHFSWQPPDGKVHQRQIYLMGDQFTAITITYRESEAVDADDRWNSIIDTFNPRFI